MKKISIVLLAFCLLFASCQTTKGIDDALSIQDVIALYEDDSGTWDGKSVIERVKELLPDGINATDTAGYTLLIYASYAGDTELVNSLIAEGADLDVKDNDSWTALIIAAEEGQTEVLKTL